MLTKNKYLQHILEGGFFFTESIYIQQNTRQRMIISGNGEALMH